MVLTPLLALASAFPQESTPSRIDTCEVWRTVDDESVPCRLGVISAVETDSQGRFQLPDRQQQIMRFDAEGNYEGVVAGPGPGPGELERTF